VSRKVSSIGEQHCHGVGSGSIKSGFAVWGLKSRVWGIGFWDLGLGFGNDAYAVSITERVSGLNFVR